jgi:outer membrane protein assembly factor BamB
MKTKEENFAHTATSGIYKQTRILSSICAIASITAADGFSQTPGTKLWDFVTGGEIYSSAAIASDGTIYFGSRDKKLYALEPAGTKKWDFSTADWVDAAPAIGPDGTVYVGSRDGQLYAVAPTTGNKLWEFPTAGSVTNPPAIGSNGTVYFTS